jgi:lipopolysaccharide cholinephosphotransferase
LTEDVDRGAVRERSEEMERLHRLLAYMLTELDRVSRKNGLTYFVAYGTLLGAVRERGAIDWDVDADVWVPVADYDALRSALSAELPQNLRLYDPESDPKYEHTFARIGFDGVDHNVIHVDLFPLGSGPESPFGRFAYAILVKFVNLFFMLKLVRVEEKTQYGLRKRAIARLAKIPLAFVPSQALLRAINRLRKKRFAGRTIADSCGLFGARQFFEAAWFESAKRIEFEGARLSAPIGAEPFLERMYGDFMNPIPAHEQKEQLEIAYRHYVTPLRQLGLIAD